MSTVNFVSIVSKNYYKLVYVCVCVREGSEVEYDCVILDKVTQFGFVHFMCYSNNYRQCAGEQILMRLKLSHFRRKTTFFTGKNPKMSAIVSGEHNYLYITSNACP